MSTLDIKVNFFFDEKEITTNQWKLGDLGPFLLRSTWDIYQKFLVQLDFPPGTFYNLLSQGWCKIKGVEG